MTNYNETSVSELKLYIENCVKLHERRVIPIRKNLIKKLEKNKYDHEKAPKLWRYLADEGAKAYHKEFGDNIFSVADRKQVAQELADQFLSDYKNGEYNI